jgi:PAS domain S-box-containing protein
MQETEIQYVLKRLYEELNQFVETVREIPYVALPLGQPKIICFAQRIRELSGYDADEILADKKHWANLIHPDDREKVFAAYTECKKLGVSFEVEYRIIHKDGSLRRVMDKGEPVFNGRGDILHIEGAIILVDQSEKMKSIAVSNMPKVTAFNNDNLCALRKDFKNRYPKNSKRLSYG